MVRLRLAGKLSFRLEHRNVRKKPLNDIIESGGITRFNKKATYHYNGNDIPITVMGIHYGFSVANALAYGLLAERFPRITALKGSLFGVAIHIAFHEYLLPKLKLTPQVKDLPYEERLSELFGHIVWMNTIDMIRDSSK